MDKLGYLSEPQVTSIREAWTSRTSWGLSSATSCSCGIFGFETGGVLNSYKLGIESGKSQTNELLGTGLLVSKFTAKSANGLFGCIMLEAEGFEGGESILRLW